MAGCKDCAAGTAHTFEHGSITGYTHHRCRCEPCKLFWRGYQRAYKRNRSPETVERDRQRVIAHRARNLEAHRKRDREAKRVERQDPDRRERHREQSRDSYARQGDRINAELRETRRLDGDRLRQRDTDYRRRNRDVLNAKLRERYAADPDLRAHRATKDREYRERNHPEVLKRQRAQARSNSVERNAQAAQWRQQNPDNVARWHQKTRERYHNDPVFRAKKDQNDRDYAEANREAVRERQHAYNVRNRENFYAKKQARRKQVEAALPNPRAGQEYTPAEDEIVLRDDLSVIDKALKLGRSYSSVAGRLHGIRTGRIKGRKRSECAQGHEFTEENTYVAPASGWRTCRACNRARKLAAAAARKHQEAS